MNIRLPGGRRIGGNLPSPFFETRQICIQTVVGIRNEDTCSRKIRLLL